MLSLLWQNPSPNLVLLDDEIHLWRANLNLSSQGLELLAKILSEAEQLRANRFRFEIHKKRFIAARGILRQLLALYLPSSAAKIEFSYNQQGKPQLASCHSNSSLQFNISHSQDLALYSFSCHQEIGIDLEYLRNNIDYKNIAQRFFCEREYNLIINCDPQKQQERFYQFWTAKEAYLKAIGEGLGGGLKTLEIDLDQAGNIYLYNINNKAQLVDDWYLYNFMPEKDFIATIALSGKKKTLIPINYIQKLQHFA